MKTEIISREFDDEVDVKEPKPFVLYKAYRGNKTQIGFVSPHNQNVFIILGAGYNGYLCWNPVSVYDKFEPIKGSVTVKFSND